MLCAKCTCHAVRESGCRVRDRIRIERSRKGNSGPGEAEFDEMIDISERHVKQ